MNLKVESIYNTHVFSISSYFMMQYRQMSLWFPSSPTDVCVQTDFLADALIHTVWATDLAGEQKARNRILKANLQTWRPLSRQVKLSRHQKGSTECWDTTGNLSSVLVARFRCSPSPCVVSPSLCCNHAVKIWLHINFVSILENVQISRTSTPLLKCVLAGGF